MTREEAKRKAWAEWHDGLDYVPAINQLYSRGFDAGRDSIEPEVRSVIEQLDALAQVWGDEGVFRRCRDRLKDAAGVAK